MQDIQRYQNALNDFYNNLINVHKPTERYTFLIPHSPFPAFRFTGTA